MLETVAAACRALACDVKLGILHALCIHEELPVGQLAASVRMPADWVSNHLARLAALGLLHRRRSGPHVYYRLAPDSREPQTFVPTRLVRRAFNDPAWGARGWGTNALLHLGSRSAAVLGERAARAADVIFDAATAFGNVRRLQLVRLLIERGPCEGVVFVAELQMSPDACWRHVDKLVRRGYLRAVRRGAWRLDPRGRTPFHSGLLSYVVRALCAKSRS